MLICVWFKVSGGWRENSPQEAAGLLFHPPALLLVQHAGEKRIIQSRNSSPCCCTFQRQRTNEKGRREEKTLQSSSHEKYHHQTLCFRLPSQGQPIPLLLTSPVWNSMTKRRSWNDAFPCCVAGVRLSDEENILISHDGLAVFTVPSWGDNIPNLFSYLDEAETNTFTDFQLLEREWGRRGW